MDISPFISALLRRYDEVNLPNLGVLYKSKLQASFDNNKQQFSPPKIILAFKQEENHNGKLLVKYISKEKHISEEAAAYFIYKHLEAIRKQLHINGKASLGKLGTFFLKDAIVSFQASVEANELVNIQNYGLTVVKEQAEAPNEKESLSKHRGEAIRESVFLTINTIKEQLATTPTVQNNTPDKLTATLQKKEVITSEQVQRSLVAEEKKIPKFKKRQKQWNGLIIIIASLCILIACAYFFIPKLYIHKLQEYMSFYIGIQQKTGPRLHGGGLKTKPLISHKKIKDIASNDSVSFVLRGDSLTTQRKHTNQEDPQKYEIIGAAFPNLKEAESYVKNMQKRGIASKIISESRKGLIKVSIGSFNDYAIAQRELNHIHKTINKEAWIWVQDARSK